MKKKGLKNKNISISTLLTLYVLFGIIFILIVIGTDVSKYRVNDLFDINAAKVDNELNDLIATQDATIKKLKSK